MKQGPAFEFVVDTGTTRHRDARAIIRRQAARSGRQAQLLETGAQEHGRYAGTTDMPVEPNDDAEGVIDVSPRTQRRHVPLMRLERAVSPATQPSFTGYEAIRVIYNFDITNLDSFTNVDLAVNAYRLLQGSAEHPVVFLQNVSSSSFLAHLPSRYGSKPFLDDAIHCVAAKAAQIFGYSTASSSPSALYFKALRSLRRNIQSSDWSDIYCATRLLVLYEVKVIRCSLMPCIDDDNASS